MQTKPRTQPALRAAYPASLAILATAAEAARNSRQIVADFRAQFAVDDCDMEALAAAARRAPYPESSDERRELRDLVINADKASGEYDRRRSGGRVGVWA